MRSENQIFTDWIKEIQLRPDTSITERGGLQTPERLRSTALHLDYMGVSRAGGTLGVISSGNCWFNLAEHDQV